MINNPYYELCYDNIISAEEIKNMPTGLRKGGNKMDKGKVLCYWELEKGKKYDEFYDVIDYEYISRYELRNNGLFYFKFNNYSCRTMENIMKMKFVEIPWKPKKNEYYFCIDMNDINGYRKMYNQEWRIDRRRIKHGKIARTKEEIIKIRNQQEWWSSKLDDDD